MIRACLIHRKIKTIIFLRQLGLCCKHGQSCWPKFGEFFVERDFLEIETPILSQDIVIDRHLDPFVTKWSR